jgi:hypothetical protein
VTACGRSFSRLSSFASAADQSSFSLKRWRMLESHSSSSVTYCCSIDDSLLMCRPSPPRKCLSVQS